MRFRVKYYVDTRLIHTDDTDNTPMMRACQTVADKIGANRFDIHDSESKQFKRVRRVGGAWNSNMVRREQAVR